MKLDNIEYIIGKGVDEMSILDNQYFNLLQRSLNASTMRQRVIANNIANNDVPNFKRSEVNFEEQLAAELSKSTSSFSAHRTDARHLSFGSGQTANARIVQDNTSTMNNNGNNVDVELEMANLAKTQLAYNMYVGQVNHELAMLRKAIGGRG